MEAEILMEGRGVVGMVSLRNGELGVNAPDSIHRERIEHAFAVGDLTYAWGGFEGGEWLEFKAARLTPKWFRAVLHLRLADEGYRYKMTEW